MPIVLEVDSKELDSVSEFYGVVRIAKDKIGRAVGKKVVERVEIERSGRPLY